MSWTGSRNREYLADSKCLNIHDPIPTEEELDNTLKLDDSSFCPDLSIVTGSSNQDQTLMNELSYFDEFNLLSSTVITIDNKTLKEKLKTSLTRDFIISNNYSDDDKSDTEVVNQDNPIIVNNEEMTVVIPNSQ